MLELNFEKNRGLVTAIAQDYITKEILMQAYMNRDAWEETLKSGKAVYFSRSRNRLWKKGESSGNQQIVKEIRVDCDMDSVLLLVDQIGGAACHEGYKSCFYRKVIDSEMEVIGERIFNPDDVYNKKP